MQQTVPVTVVGDQRIYDLDARIGVLETEEGVRFYAFANGYNRPETVGTREEVEAALGLRPEPLGARPGRRTAGGGWVLGFGRIKGKPLIVEITQADRVLADVRCGEFGCSLALLSDLGTIDEGGPQVAEDVIEQMEKWAVSKGW